MSKWHFLNTLGPSRGLIYWNWKKAKWSRDLAHTILVMEGKVLLECHHDHYCLEVSLFSSKIIFISCHLTCQVPVVQPIVPEKTRSWNSLLHINHVIICTYHYSLLTFILWQLHGQIVASLWCCHIPYILHSYIFPKLLTNFLLGVNVYLAFSVCNY